MNENIDLTKILKNCPKGTKLYSIAYGDVEFDKIAESKEYPINIRVDDYHIGSLTANGQIYANCNGECALFPSKDQRDWSKFTAPWLKKERFDPKNLMPFDKVLVRDNNSSCWRCAFYSHQRETEGSNSYRYVTTASSFICCIPYNDDTKHLVGTNEEAPEYYQYWEDRVMIRDEQIIAEAKKHYYDDINCHNAFLHGVEWADAHPIDVWHDAKKPD